MHGSRLLRKKNNYNNNKLKFSYELLLLKIRKRLSYFHSMGVREGGKKGNRTCWELVEMSERETESIRVKPKMPRNPSFGDMKRQSGFTPDHFFSSTTSSKSFKWRSFTPPSVDTKTTQNHLSRLLQHLVHENYDICKMIVLSNWKKKLWKI